VAGVAGFHPAGGLAPAQERGAWVIPLSARPTQVDLNDLPVR